MKIPVTCTSAMAVVSPNPPDNYTNYRFAYKGKPLETIGQAYFDNGLWVNDKPGVYEVGKPYEIAIIVSLPHVRNEDGTPFVPGSM